MLQIICFIIPRELDFVVSAPTTQQVTTIREQKRERTTAFMNNIARQLESGDVKRCPRREALALFARNSLVVFFNE